MKPMLWIFLASIAACHDGPDPTHLEKDLLHLEAKIPLPKVSGRIDHLAYDSAGHRVFVAALGNNTVEVVDLANRKLIHSITGLREPQGVLYVPNLQRLVVANAGNGAVIFYDSRSYAELARVDLGDDADNLRFDGSHIYVGYGSGGIAVIDPATIRKVGDLALKGHPESFRLDDSDRIFINVPDEGEIVTGDLRTLTIQNEWKNDKASANFPMALDHERKRLVVGYRHPAQLRILDSRTGNVLGSAACVSDADDLFYYSPSGLIFVSGGEGYIDVFRVNDRDARPALVNHLATRKGARTALWLPDGKKLILAVPARGGEEAALWVFECRP
jgi:YVTN family beta-propeller protein